MKHIFFKVKERKKKIYNKGRKKNKVKDNKTIREITRKCFL